MLFLTALILRRSCRPFLKSRTVHQLIEQILDHQDHLYINMYESDPNMTLDERKNVTLIGPDKNLARRLNNKTVQFELLKEIVPVVDFQSMYRL